MLEQLARRVSFVFVRILVLISTYEMNAMSVNDIQQ